MHAAARSRSRLLILAVLGLLAALATALLLSRGLLHPALAMHYHGHHGQLAMHFHGHLHLASMHYFGRAP